MKALTFVLALVDLDGTWQDVEDEGWRMAGAEAGRNEDAAAAFETRVRAILSAVPASTVCVRTVIHR